MTRSVALPERTYTRLKNNRRPGESFSQAVDRLLDSAQKNPWRFVSGRKSRLDPEERIRRIESDRDRATVRA